MKPIIIIVGAPHSMTSAIAKFLVQNGGWMGEDKDSPMEYPVYENKQFATATTKKYGFKRADFSFMKDLPTDEVVILKSPLAIFHLGYLNGHRPIKIVYVMRNPLQVIASSLEKSDREFKDFNFYLRRWCAIYETAAQTFDYELLPFMAERLENDAMRLLEFCELPTDNINFDGIRPVQRRSPYLKYRINNFIFKRLKLV